MSQAPSRQSSIRSFQDEASEADNTGGGFWQGWGLPGINIFAAAPEPPAEHHSNLPSFLADVAKHGGQVFETLYSTWGKIDQRKKKKKLVKAKAYHKIKEKQDTLDAQTNSYFVPYVARIKKIVSTIEDQDWESTWANRRLEGCANDQLIGDVQIKLLPPTKELLPPLEGFTEWVTKRLFPFEKPNPVYYGF